MVSRRMLSWGGALMVCAAALGLRIEPAAAQANSFYASKNLNVLVGVAVGGTVDTTVRRFAPFLKQHLQGSPTVIVQNMTGGGSNLVFNYLAEKATPDGLTIVYSSYQALAQALGDNSLRVRFENFEYLGGMGDTRVSYARTDTVKGGMKAPKDIMKSGEVIVGGYSYSDFESTLSHLSLDVLGVKNKRIIGYRGGADIFLAMQRGEVQFHNTSLGSYRTRTAPFVASGEGMGLYYLAPIRDGQVVPNTGITDMPSFPDLYKEVHGALPTGNNWEALNWLTSQTSELAYAAFAPKGTPPELLAQLRAAFETASNDPEFVRQSVQANGVPYSFVEVSRGQGIITSLASVSPDILTALKASMANPN